MSRLCRLVLVLYATLNGVRLAASVDDLLRELRTHVKSVHSFIRSFVFY